jgi:HPt (histidine-containing phosphotransfer) domain-containing protein
MDAAVMADLRDRLLARVRSEATMLEGPEPTDPERRATVLAWCHRIGGTAGTIGLSDLSAAALEMEAGLMQEGRFAWAELRGRLLAALQES